MSQKELKRVAVMGAVKEGAISLVEGSEKLGVSYRQTKRIWSAFLRNGVFGLVHGNRGKIAWNRVDEKTQSRVTDLALRKYRVCNDVHCWEKIVGEERIEIGREKIRQWRRGGGMSPKRRRRSRKHHKRRERKEQFGLMLLWDGSPHRWFGPDREPCCLMAAIDDATGHLVGAVFVEAESSLGYLKLLDQIVRKYGIPASIYHDRHSSLVRCDDYWSLEEQMNGKQDPTQVGAVLESLGITSIPAYSAQAKGRIERAFGVLQDRLIAEMSLAGIRDPETANPWLLKVYLPQHNKQFGISPKNRVKRFRGKKGIDIKKLISFSYQATVLNDNTVRLGGLVMDIPKGPQGRSYAKGSVTVRQLLDGTWRIYYQNQLIGTYKTTKISEPIRARIKRKNQAKATKEFTWIYLSSKNTPPKGTFLLGS